MLPCKPKTFQQARTAIAKKQMAKMTNVNTSRAMMANKREFHRRKLEKLEKKQKQRQEREKAETPAAISDNNNAAPKPPSPVDNPDDLFPQAPKRPTQSQRPRSAAFLAAPRRRRGQRTKRRSQRRRSCDAAVPPAQKNQRLHALALAPPPPPPPQTTAKTRVGEMIELDLAKSTASSLRERGPARGSESEGPRRSAYVPSQAESSVQRMNRLTAESRTAYGSKEFGWDQGGTRAG
ncbi:hypothetical protein IWX49DRAFT_550765 [Phyllosticta citricarpa]|uniref:Uncharacterized protein n=1 Tax=Phyllosticta citricarpa TaxID=55181 RepID=A0ABR1MBX7_9PEZI